MTKRIVPLLVTLAAALLALLAGGGGGTLTAQQGGQSLEGSWRVVVKPDMPPAPGVAEFLNLGTFMPDGGVIASDGYITDSACHGTWVRTGNRQFAVTCLGLGYGPSGHTEYTFKLRTKLAYTDRASELAGPFAIDMGDANGNNWVTVVTGTAQLFPINVEQLP